MGSERPRGFAILAVSGLVTSLVGALAILGFGGLAILVDLDVLGAGHALLIGLTLLAVAAVQLVVAVGYWRMRPWRTADTPDHRVGRSQPSSAANSSRKRAVIRAASAA